VFELLLLGAAVCLAIRLDALSQRLARLEQRLGEAEEQAAARRLAAPQAPPPPSPAAQSPEAPSSAAPSPTAPLEPPRRLPPVAALTPQAPVAPPARKPAPSPVPVPRSAPVRNESWRRLERALIENWTGILGVVVLVAGVTFLAVSLALRLGPLTRFLLTILVALAMMVPSVLWGRRQRWRRLSLWMRSGGAALILFACVAAGGLPELGLRWLNDPRQALALMLMGMAINLTVATIARQQTTASLHVVVNLLPLLLVPSNGITLAIASLVSLLGQVLPRRRAWHRHRLIVTAAYALFQSCWFVAAPISLLASPGVRAGGVLAAVVVFATGLLQRHGGRALRRAFTPMQLATLLLQWGGIALAVLLYPRQAAVRATALALAAALALLLSRRARRGGAPSLALADTLCAQALTMGAILSLAPLVVDPLLLLGVLLVECALFLALGLLEGDMRLQRIGWPVLLTVAVVMLVVGLLASLGLAMPRPPPLQNSAVLLSGSALLTGISALLQRRPGVAKPPAFAGVQAAGLAFAGSFLVAPPAWQPPLSFLALGALLLTARRFQPPGLLQGVSAAVLAIHLLQVMSLLLQAQRGLVALPPLLALCGLAVLTIASGGRSRLRLVGVVLLGLDLGLAAFLLLQPISPLLPGLAWLLLSLLALEAANRLRRPESLHVLGLGLGYLAAYAVSYLLVISQSPAYLVVLGQSLAARLLIQLFALAVLLGWWFFHPRPALRQASLWSAVHPCILELILLAIGVLILSEVGALWRPVAWSLLALGLLAPAMERWFAPRLQVYAVFGYWLAGVTTVAMLSTGETASTRWLQQPQTIGLLAIALQGLFLLVATRWLRPEALRAPGGLPLLAAIGIPVSRQPHRWLGYPLFLAVALYLASRYDRAVLTLLWALLAFAIYILSAVLRDNQFRAVALLATGACMVRLVAVDMAQADLTLRGVVFVGVGLLMLAMNAFYNRFRERFR
jgi:hypothetical protein